MQKEGFSNSATVIAVLASRALGLLTFRVILDPGHNKASEYKASGYADDFVKHRTALKKDRQLRPVEDKQPRALHARGHLDLDIIGHRAVRGADLSALLHIETVKRIEQPLRARKRRPPQWID